MLRNIFYTNIIVLAWNSDTVVTTLSANAFRKQLNTVNIEKFLIVTGSIARSASRRYLVYSEADFSGFSPRRGDTLHRWGGVKFGMGPLLHAKRHPQQCNDKGVGPQKLKFLLRFDQNVEYKRPATPRMGVSLARLSHNLYYLYPVSGCVSC